MEKARMKGKQKENTADSEARELNHIMELVGKAADRKLVDLVSVVDRGRRRDGRVEGVGACDEM